MEVISESVRTFLATKPTQDTLFEFIKSYIPKQIKPTGFLHEINLKIQKNPICLYATLMVQDVRDSYLYYPILVKKPINQDSEFQFFKYGNSKIDILPLLQDDQYAKVLMDRQTIICSSIKYETQWLKNLKGYQHLYEHIQMVVDGRSDFKLGQVFHSVCIWDPISQKLHFVRQVPQKEVLEVGLDKWHGIYSQKQINFCEQKQKVLKAMSKVFSQKYSQYLLYSLISNQKMFISGENLQEIASEVLPRVARIQIKAPFKDSLFPYKNSDAMLIETPMQMSSLKTFVILDFSHLTNSSQIKIQQQQIDNLKALKVFVEQSNTIYRWQYGESLVKHCHSGIIVKASNIITPDFNFKGQLVQWNNPFKEMSEEQKLNIRIYIQKVQKLCPLLGDKPRKQIEQDLKAQKSIKKEKVDLRNLMRLSKLRAMSEGRLQITYQDYIHSCSITL